MNRRLLMGLLMMFATHISFAQTGSLAGAITEKETGLEIIGAVVELIQEGIIKGGAVTDVDGKYSIQGIDPASDYRLRIRYQGFTEVTFSNLSVGSDRTTYQNTTMEEMTTDCGFVCYYPCRYMPLPELGEEDEEEEIFEMDWKCYPNPTSGTLYIEHGDERTEYYITDIMGKTVASGITTSNSRTEVNMAGYPAGVYLLWYPGDSREWASHEIMVVH